MIKSIELQGFKSFDRRISIPLSKGITAIVGPNGSGKSNIVDAFCFVLGRTSAKSMRADRLTHLINNGGTKKQPAPFLEVALGFDNSDGKFAVDSEEVKITRRLTRNGTMTYKINDDKCTRSQLIDILSLSRLNPEGYNIILQGDITAFIDMDPVQRRGIIDEICGIAEYDAKKIEAQKDLTRVEENIKEIVIMMSERKKRIDDLAKEKEDAERYQLYKTDLSRVEANLAYSKTKKIEAESLQISSELKVREDEEKEVLKNLRAVESGISKKERELNELDKRLIREGGEEQFNIRAEIENLKTRVQVAESKIASKKAEISGIDSIISRLQSIAEEEEDTKVLTLKQNVKGIHGTVSNLYKVDAKYAAAIDSSVGGRANYIVVENENVALECIEFLKKNQIGRATFLPLSLIRGQELEHAKEKGILGLAINYVKFDSKYKKIFEYVFGNTYVVEDLRKIKPLLGKYRLVSLDGDLADKSGAISGGYKRLQQSKASTEIENYIQKRDSLLDEIEALKIEINDLNGRLKTSNEKETKFGTEFQGLRTMRDLIEGELEKMRSERENISNEHDAVVRKVGDLRVIKATVDQRLDDARINLKRFAQQKFEEIEVGQAERQVDEFMRKITALEPVNMKAMQEYELEVQSFKEFEGKFNKLQEERKSVLNFIDEIEGRKKEVFFGTFNKVAEEFSKIFPKLSPSGEAKLILEKPEDPLNGGMLVESRPAGKKFQSLELLSGGEKVLTALAFLFALQRFKPAPLYILDEVDAALDQHNSLRFVELLRENIGNGQMLIISHNPAVIKKVDRLFGISMTAEGASRLIGLDLTEYQAAPIPRAE
ncbi:TPA: AAA family ATPase [archaeon]|uniref:AAA family ATPase n=1 Tax=Candidatus Naiadarchaeum limnaeum TaxID=2756139 RepID=A0A832URR5_9ARCH|nr:AAA family ATPase [Candidatus Naiadarchaeales archaeon SRR2090153.bin1042]HIK00392.1 AAA family ATPase [Candidatus Naiadarchaeum limnaeum]